MIPLLLLWLLQAGAQEPVDSPTESPAEAPDADPSPTPAAPAPGAVPAPDPVDPSLEIVVWGEGAIRQARAQVTRELEDMGYRRLREADGEIVFRPPVAWMGRARLSYDGDLVLGRPVLALKDARARVTYEAGENPHFDRDPVGAARPVAGGGAVYEPPFPEGSFWLLPSWRVVGPAHDRVRRQIDPALREYREVVERTRELTRTLQQVRRLPQAPER